MRPGPDCDARGSGPVSDVLRARARALGPRAGLFITAAIVLVVSNLVDLSAIASVGSACSLVVFLLVAIAGYRLRAETGARGAIVLVGVAMTVVVLAFFSIDTLRNSSGDVRCDRRDRRACGDSRHRVEASARRATAGGATAGVLRSGLAACRRRRDRIRRPSRSRRYTADPAGRFPGRVPPPLRAGGPRRRVPDRRSRGAGPRARRVRWGSSGPRSPRRRRSSRSRSARFPTSAATRFASDRRSSTSTRSLVSTSSSRISSTGASTDEALAALAELQASPLGRSVAARARADTRLPVRR